MRTTSANGCALRYLGGHDLILGLASAANLNNRGSRKSFWELGTGFRRILAPSRAPFQSNFSSRRFAALCFINSLSLHCNEGISRWGETVSSLFTVLVRPIQERLRPLPVLGKDRVS